MFSSPQFASISHKKKFPHQRYVIWTTARDWLAHAKRNLQSRVSRDVQRCSQLKRTRTKFTTSMDLGIVWPPTWVELARDGLNLIKLKFALNSSQMSTSGQSASSSQLSPSCFVIVLWPRGRIPTIEWFLAIWLDLAVSFGHPAMRKFWFNVIWIELAWVGEYRLARALVGQRRFSFKLICRCSTRFRIIQSLILFGKTTAVGFSICGIHLIVEFSRTTIHFSGCPGNTAFSFQSHSAAMNVKFLLQPHQKYYITQYEELGFS